MATKTDFIPALREQHTIHQSRNLSSLILHQPALKFVFDAGIVLITFFAVFSGFPDSKENLEKMGISLGPNHL
jgi:hypothetical protein